MSPQNPHAQDDATFRHAVLFAVKTESNLGFITDHTPAFLLPLAGKCQADRIIGRLGDLGIKEITIIIDSADSAAAAQLLGDGTRWGVALHLIDIRTPQQAVERLMRMPFAEPVLLGDLYQFPQITKTTLRRLHQAETAILSGAEDGATGWASLTTVALEACQATTPEALFAHLEHTGAPRIQTSGPELRCITAKDILSSTQALLLNQISDQVVSGSSGDPGLWIGAGSIIHPTVKIVPPVWIGENCRLDRNVRLGPNACIADSCVLGQGSTIENSSVLPGTCIGRELELDGTLADRNYLAYADAGLTVAIPDSFLIAPNQPLCFTCIAGALLGRFAALLMLIPALPLLMLLWLTGRASEQSNPVETFEALRLPAASDAMLWKTFRNRRWICGEHPGWNRICGGIVPRIILALPAIAFGNLHWVGLAPRTPEETAALPDDWRMLYLGSKPGLFQLAEVDQRRIGDSSEEQQFSSEAFYASTRTLRQDVKIIWQRLFARRVPAAPASATNILSLTYDSDTLDRLHNFLNQELALPEITKTRKEAIITAVHEAMINIIEHAYELVPGHPIQLHFRNGPDLIEITLFDKGNAFDPALIAEPNFSIEAEGGFGWHIINAIAESVNYSRIGEWSQLAMSFTHQTKGNPQDEH